MGLLGRVVDFVFGLLNRSKPPELRDPSRFDRLGLRFDYPANWRITDEDVEEDEGLIAVHFETAIGGIGLVQRMGPDDDTTLAGFAEGVVGGFDEGIGDAFRVGRIRPFRVGDSAVEPCRRRIAGRDCDGVRLDLVVGGLGATVVSRFEIHEVNVPGQKIFVLANAVEVDHWELDLPGFELIWGSLRSDRPRLD